jgi:HD-GYP domain-containing protein (c-di-GMP phosphodiesterase class II)
MNEARTELIDIHQLQIGMFIELDLGWMSHPFPTGSFKISSLKQIEIIRGLGLQRVRYLPKKSERSPESPVAGAGESVSDGSVTDDAESAPTDTEAEALRPRKQRSNLLNAQQRDLIVCERRFGEAIRQYKLVIEQLDLKPRSAMEQSLGLVNAFVSEMLGQGESIIRLLSEGMGDKAAMHPVNVTIVSLLLGKSLGLSQSDMVDLGMAAFLHDIGKTQLPDRVRWLEENFSSAEYKLYQEHVPQGITLAQRMELSAGAVQAIAQHHELIDGSGFPARLRGERLSVPAKILALVNRYENLCNPSRPAAAITPHDALALIFAQLKTRFDSVALSAFIRMMGVYPPGSVVQLVDERFAIVVSVNSSRPLKPRVIVYEPGISKHEALILDLEQAPNIGIRRSLKPSALPKAAMDYLSPRQRICYFFERAIDSPPAEESL